MMTKIALCLLVLFIFSMPAFAQNNQAENPAATAIQSTNPVENISAELIKISKSLQIFNKNFKAFFEQLSQGSKFSEKQQNLLLGYEILNRAEERVRILQNFQIDLTEKQGNVRTRLAQVEQDITPEGIDRSVVFLGTTKTEENRDSRRRTLEAERTNLRQLSAQINQNLADTANELRQAASFVKRLRDKILPQIEQQISDL